MTSHNASVFSQRVRLEKRAKKETVSIIAKKCLLCFFSETKIWNSVSVPNEHFISSLSVIDVLLNNDLNFASISKFAPQNES